jgi:hypothetical protein
VDSENERKGESCGTAYAISQSNGEPTWKGQIFGHSQVFFQGEAQNVLTNLCSRNYVYF